MKQNDINQKKITGKYYEIIIYVTHIPGSIYIIYNIYTHMHKHTSLYIDTRVFLRKVATNLSRIII